MEIKTSRHFVKVFGHTLVFGGGCGALEGLGRRSPVLPGVDCLVAELFLDSQQLVVLCHALGAAWGASLDLTRLEADDEIGNEGVFRLAAAVGNHHVPTSGVTHLAGLDRLGQRTNLVHLEEQCVASLLVDSILNARRVRHEEIVAHDLRPFTNRRRQVAVTFEIVLIEGVFNGHDRVLFDHIAVDGRKLLGRHVAVFVVYIALVFVFEI